MTAQHLPRDEVRPSSALQKLAQTIKKVDWTQIRQRLKSH